MPQISIKPGDSLTIATLENDIAIQFKKFHDGFIQLKVDDRFCDVSVVRGPEPESEPEPEPVPEPVAEPTEEEIQAHLWELSREISDGLSKLGLDNRKEFLGALVGELYYSTAAQDRSDKNRQRQREAVAAAKVRGVRFGPARKPLPDNFDEYHQKWRLGEMKMREAARACGMPKTTFRVAVLRKEQEDSCAV